MGVRIAPMVMTLAVASGAALPVSGSLGCEFMMRRQNGSDRIAIIVPVPIPTKARPDVPGPQPRCSLNTMG